MEMREDMAPTRLADRLEEDTPARVAGRPRQSPADSPQCADAVPDSDCLPMLRKLSKGRSVHVCAGDQSHGLSTQHLEPSLNVAVAGSHVSACSLAHRYQQPNPAVALNPDCSPGELSRDHPLYVCAGSQPRELLITPSHTYYYTLKHDAHGYPKDLYARNYRNNGGVNKCYNPNVQTKYANTHSITTTTSTHFTIGDPMPTNRCETTNSVDLRNDWESSDEANKYLSPPTRIEHTNKHVTLNKLIFSIGKPLLSSKTTHGESGKCLDGQLSLAGEGSGCRIREICCTTRMKLGTFLKRYLTDVHLELQFCRIDAKFGTRCHHVDTHHTPYATHTNITCGVEKTWYRWRGATSENIHIKLILSRKEKGSSAMARTRVHCTWPHKCRNKRTGLKSRKLDGGGEARVRREATSENTRAELGPNRKENGGTATTRVPVHHTCAYTETTAAMGNMCWGGRVQLAEPQNTGRVWGYRGTRVGEASHPGPQGDDNDHYQETDEQEEMEARRQHNACETILEKEGGRRGEHENWILDDLDKRGEGIGMRVVGQNFERKLYASEKNIVEAVEKMIRLEIDVLVGTEPGKASRFNVKQVKAVTRRYGFDVKLIKRDGNKNGGGVIMIMNQRWSKIPSVVTEYRPEKAHLRGRLMCLEFDNRQGGQHHKVQIIGAHLLNSAHQEMQDTKKLLSWIVQRKADFNAENDRAPTILIGDLNAAESSYLDTDREGVEHDSVLLEPDSIVIETIKSMRYEDLIRTRFPDKRVVTRAATHQTNRLLDRVMVNKQLANHMQTRVGVYRHSFLKAGSDHMMVVADLPIDTAGAAGKQIKIWEPYSYVKWSARKYASILRLGVGRLYDM